MPGVAAAPPRLVLQVACGESFFAVLLAEAGRHGSTLVGMGTMFEETFDAALGAADLELRLGGRLAPLPVIGPAGGRDSESWPPPGPAADGVSRSADRPPPPPPPPPPPRVVSLAAGHSHLVALCADGTAHGMGAAASGQLGLGVPSQPLQRNFCPPSQVRRRCPLACPLVCPSACSLACPLACPFQVHACAKARRGLKM